MDPDHPYSHQGKPPDKTHLRDPAQRLGLESVLGLESAQDVGQLHRNR